MATLIANLDKYELVMLQRASVSKPVTLATHGPVNILNWIALGILTFDHGVDRNDEVCGRWVGDRVVSCSSSTKQMHAELSDIDLALRELVTNGNGFGKMNLYYFATSTFEDITALVENYVNRHAEGSVLTLLFNRNSDIDIRNGSTLHRISNSVMS